MIRRRPTILAIAFLTAILLLAAGADPAGADPGPPPGTPSAISFGGVPSVGALFDNGLSQPHSCSASVVLSPGRDLVLTAAHCISGTGAGLKFVPGYVNGKTPYGVWTVQRAWVSPTSITSQDPHDDYAFLEVAPQKIGKRTINVQDRTGGSILGLAAPTGTKVTDIAYPYGINDEPISCTNKLVATDGYPTFNCNGYPGGTSGSPFLISHHGLPNVVVGVIGGLHQGGCYEWNSFSSPFSWTTLGTYLRAALRLRADIVPTAGGDGC